MPLRQYGVLKGRVVDHIRTQRRYEMLIATQNKSRKFRASVNLKSSEFPLNLLYYTIHDFKHPLTADLRKLPIGYSELEKIPDNASLDYIRDNIFDPSRMMIPSFDDYSGKLNDLHHELDLFVEPMLPTGTEKVEFVTKRDKTQPLIYVFGERWGPEPDKDDDYFNFRPGNGMHKIHMNQGNVSQYAYTDGIWQDGGLLFYYPDEDRWSAVFLAFQTQAFHTDDATGARLLPEPTPESPETPGTPDIPARTTLPRVRIVASLINPVGNDLGKETVILLNTTDEPIHLAGWRLVDKQHREDSLDHITLEPNVETTIALGVTGMVLSNRGGTITLVDTKGIKVNGVSYVRRDAYEEGKIVRFDE